MSERSIDSATDSATDSTTDAAQPALATDGDRRREVRRSPLRDRIAAFVAAESAERRAAIAEARGESAARRAAEVEIDHLPYGPDDEGALECEILANAGPVELEYAAIRSGCGIFDANHRGTLLVTGPDRRDFLNRMLTAELKDLDAGRSVEAFWLNRKGRIDADLRLAERGDAVVAELDVHSVAGAVESLGRFLVAEDAEVVDASKDLQHLWLLGPRTRSVVEEAAGSPPPPVGRCAVLQIAGVDCLLSGLDWTGDSGVSLLVPRADAAVVWDALLAAGGRGRQVRPIGWLAFNVARIESGTPLFNVDFGPDNLPHESGVLRRRVSFTKGCYLGQEVVARMESLGKPKQTLVGLRIDGEALPVAGSQVFSIEDDAMGPCVGGVTSSTPSPMLGAAPVAFAMVKSAHATPGTTLLVNAEGAQSRATVGPLRFFGAVASEPGGDS
jgi:folate-binding protein YgfZ